MTHQPSLSLEATPARRRRWVRDRGPYLLIAPFFLLLLAFGLFPLLFSFAISFFDWNPLGGLDGLARAKWAGLWAYQNVFTDNFYWPALWRAISGGLLSSLPQHLVAIPLAFGLSLAFRRLQGVMGTLLFLPYVTPQVASSAVLSVLFLIVWRPLGDLLGALGALPLVGPFLHGLDYDASYSAFTTIWTTLGWNVLLYLMALNVIPRSLFEAAQVDGAGLWRQFTRIALPLIRPMIFVAFTMSFLAGVQANVWAPAFTDLQTMSLPAYIFRTGFFDFDMGLAAAQTWVFFGCLLVVVGLAYLLVGRNFSSLDVSAHGESAEVPIRLRPATLVALKIVLAGAVLAALLPIVALFVSVTRMSPGFSFQTGDMLPINLQDLQDAVPTFWRNLWNTLYVSGLAALGAMLVSSLAGFAFALTDFRFKRGLYLMVLGVMLFPSLLNIIPTAMTMHLYGWTDQARALWVPAAASAFGIFLARQYLESAVPRSVVEAARIDGAGTLRLYGQVIVPLARPVLVTTGLITFIGTWNGSMNALGLLHSPETYLVGQALSTAVKSDGSGASALLTGTALASLPGFVLFLLASGQMMRGLNLGWAPVGQLRDGWTRLWRRLRTPSPRQAGFLPGADGLRAIACLMVIGHHLSQRLGMDGQTPFVHEAQAFVMTGNAGVSAFFVLSGLLLSLPFWRRYLAGRPAPDLREYARRRFRRIAPGFWASLGVSVLLTVALVPDVVAPWWRLLAGASFTSAFHWLTFFPADLNGPLWSIGFEVACYALLPLGMWGLFRLGRRGPLTGLLYWLAALGVVLLAHQFVLTHLVPDAEGRGWQYGVVGGGKFWMPNYNPLGFFGHYALGVLAALFVAWRQARGQRPAWSFDLVALLAAALTVTLQYATRHDTDFQLSLGAQPYHYPLFAGLIALLLAALPFSRLAAALLDNRLFRFTARLSFGLYIWHYLILEVIRLLYDDRFVYGGMPTLGGWAGLSAVALLLAYGAALLSYRHIEAPFLREGAARQGTPSPDRAPSPLP